MEAQKISRSGLQELYNLSDVCSGYKTKIEEYLKKDLFSSEIQISQDDIEKAFSAANTGQKKAMLKYFKKTTTGLEEIKDFKDVLKALKITQASLGLIKNARSAEDKCANALKKLLCIAKLYNKGWIPNWTNSNEYKYFPYLYFSEGSWVLGVNCNLYGVGFPSGLYFRTEPLAQLAIETFPDIYDDYLMISRKKK